MQIGRFKVLSIVLIGVLLFLQYRLWIDPNGLRDNARLKKELQQQKSENDKLKKRNDQLLAEVKHLQKDPNAMEEKAREELGMIKKGETFYQIVEQTQ